MNNFRCKICGEEFEKMPKMCPTPGCGNRNPAMWENIAPAAPRPVLTDEELRELERRKSEERRRLEAEEKARLIEQQRQQAEAEERRRLEAEEKARRLEQQRAAEAERQRELDRLRYEEQQRIQQQQTGGFSGFGNTVVNVPQAENVFSNPKKKRGKKLLVIIILLLILAIAGFVLLIVLGNKSDNADTSSKPVATEPATTTVEKTTASEATTIKQTATDVPTTTEAVTEAPTTTEAVIEAPTTTEAATEAPTTTETATEAPTTTEAATDAEYPEIIWRIGQDQAGDSHLFCHFNSSDILSSLPHGASNISLTYYHLVSDNPDTNIPDISQMKFRKIIGESYNNSEVCFVYVFQINDGYSKIFLTYELEYWIGDTQYKLQPDCYIIENSSY